MTGAWTGVKGSSCSCPPSSWGETPPSCWSSTSRWAMPLTPEYTWTRKWEKTPNHVCFSPFSSIKEITTEKRKTSTQSWSTLSKQPWNNEEFLRVEGLEVNLVQLWQHAYSLFYLSSFLYIVKTVKGTDLIWQLTYNPEKSWCAQTKLV